MLRFIIYCLLTSFVYTNDINTIYDTNTMVNNIMNFGNEKENPLP